MKIINTKETCPSEFYIFVNDMNPITHNNVNIVGSISSAAISALAMNGNNPQKYIDGDLDYLPFLPNENMFPALSMYHVSAINDYRIEYNAEINRKAYFKTYPSRLSAVYAFGDYDTCVEVHQRHNWDLNTVRRFRLKDLPYTRVAKVNMEIVSLMRHAYKISTFESDYEVWQHYWSGQGNLGLQIPDRDFKPQHIESGVIWEYLIEGALELIRE
ncbi:hypothetical protein IO785_002248 [Escherichia coli]|nr:hypothetical protein [Escherichia coli]